MAPLPPNTTARLFIEYTSVGKEHTAELRLPVGATTADAEAVYDLMAPAMAAGMASNDSVTGARFSAAGSNVSFPLGVAPDAGNLDAVSDIDMRARFVSFTGRSVDGRDVRFTFFTPYVVADPNGYRQITPTGLAAGILAVLTGLGASIRTISGLQPIWNTYANLGYNAYYQRRNRRGG